MIYVNVKYSIWEMCFKIWILSYKKVQSWYSYLNWISYFLCWKANVNAKIFDIYVPSIVYIFKTLLHFSSNSFLFSPSALYAEFWLLTMLLIALVCLKCHTKFILHKYISKWIWKYSVVCTSESICFWVHLLRITVIFADAGLVAFPFSHFLLLHKPKHNDL